MRFNWTVLCFFFVMGFIGCSSGTKTDHEVRQIFSQNRHSFDTLASMISADHSIQTMSLTSVTYVLPESPRISEERWQEYRTILNTFGPTNVFCVRRDDGTVLFLFSYSGSILGGFAKGLAFIPGTKQLKTFESLPDMEGSFRWKKEGEYVAQIEIDGTYTEENRSPKQCRQFSTGGLCEL